MDDSDVAFGDFAGSGRFGRGRESIEAGVVLGPCRNLAVRDARRLGHLTPNALARGREFGIGRRVGSFDRLGGGCLGTGLPRLATIGLTVSLVVLAGLAAATTGRRALAEYRALARLPDAPPGAKNVILIVMDTVCAENLGLQGYERETTPNLKRWAGKGVRFDMALSPAPWTYPSHSCFLTGQWPYKLNSQFQYVLNPPYPTLAESLASRGYLTAGFVANNDFCSYETGLDRGFAHYEDYPLGAADSRLFRAGPLARQELAGLERSFQPQVD